MIKLNKISNKRQKSLYESNMSYIRFTLPTWTSGCHFFMCLKRVDII